MCPDVKFLQNVIMTVLWGAGQALVQMVEDMRSRVHYAIKFFLSQGELLQTSINV